MRAGVRRPSLSAAVLRLTAVALVAAVLVCSLLYVDLVRTDGERAAAMTPRTGPDGGPAAEAPAPVTTETS
jgi:hypothetical protein